MEDINISNPLKCSSCNSLIDEDSIYCSECGFPEKGTEKEIAIFHAKKAMEKNKNFDAAKKIRSARNVLYIMAGISLLFGILYFFSQDSIEVLITNGILSIIYIVLGSYTNKKPLMAILLGLLLYLTTIIISAILDPSTLISGIIWKVLIIAYLSKGVYSASSIKKEQLS